MTVADDLKVVVSPRIREEFSNGREYYRFHGAPLAILPQDGNEKPARHFLQWHSENVFLG